jgi:uncharacterized protein YndB with AHSA1/START domain
MPVNKDSSGRRWIQVEVEVPGTPEQVWQAIATGPGVSSWFVPTDFEPREGGEGSKVTAHFGPGNSMDSVDTVTRWEPPHRFVAGGAGMGSDAPPVATEWIVEAKDGGTCTVRVVHSWFASTDDWDGQWEQAEQGWPAFFRILRLYLAHFAGQPSALFQMMGTAPEPALEAWAALTGALGIAGDTRAEVGQWVSTSGDAPSLAGAVASVGVPEYPELLIHLDTPGPGIAHLFPLPMGGQVYLPIRIFLYGEQAAATAAIAEPAWQAWIAARFSSTPEASDPEAPAPEPTAAGS